MDTSRRNVIATGVAMGSAWLGGCLERARCYASPDGHVEFTYEPSEPRVGEEVLFEAESGCIAGGMDRSVDEYHWYFDSPTSGEPDAIGSTISHVFDEEGIQTVILTGETLSGPTGDIEDASRRIDVRQPPSEIDIDEERFDIVLRGTETTVDVGEDAVITFGATNTIGGDQLEVQLILEPPSDIVVTGTRLVEQATGQYTATFDLEPGATKGMEITVQPTGTGSHDIEGRVIYRTDDDSEPEVHVAMITITAE